MVSCDMIVIGASAGGVEALQALVAQFPANLPAAVFVTLHLPTGTKSDLPNILSRSGSLRAVHPTSSEAVQEGVIYVAPPDYHLLLEDHHMHLWKGPRENRLRPAINPMFRSAAVCCGRRVAGVILTGALDDGTAGLWQIKRNGGIAIVQKDAAFPYMVESACKYVEIDYALCLDQMGDVLTALARGDATKRVPLENVRENEMETQTPVAITCPDCGGPLLAVQDGELHEFRCIVGHVFSLQSVLQAHSEREENALWAAVVALKEAAGLVDLIAPQMSEGLAARLKRQAGAKQQQALEISRIIEQLVPFDLE